MNALLNTIPAELTTRETDLAPAPGAYVDVLAALAAPRTLKAEALTLTEEWAWLTGEPVELECASDLLALEILKGL
jgi:hypothetical protein